MVMSVHVLHEYNLTNNELRMPNFHFCSRVSFRANLP